MSTCRTVVVLRTQDVAAFDVQDHLDEAARELGRRTVGYRQISDIRFLGLQPASKEPAALAAFGTHDLTDLSVAVFEADYKLIDDTAA